MTDIEATEPQTMDNAARGRGPDNASTSDESIEDTRTGENSRKAVVTIPKVSSSSQEQFGGGWNLQLSDCTDNEFCLFEKLCTKARSSMPGRELLLLKNP